jgi:hypothetical protein
MFAEIDPFAREASARLRRSKQMIGRPIKIMITVALLLTTSMIAVAHCADDAEKRPLVGEWAVAVGIMTSTACHSLDDLKRFYVLLRSGDTLAALTFAGSKNCTIVKVDTEVMVEDYSVLSGALCVRPRGEPDCLWMLDVAVKSKAAVAKDKAAAKAIADELNEAFDKEHPECKGWRVKKNLPKHCY